MDTPLPETVEVEPRVRARWSVIWLHGLGADGHDFEPLVPELRLPDSAAVRFVFPHAPQRPVTVNGGMRMRAWYDIAGPDLSAGEDEAGIRASAETAAALIEREVGRGVPAARVLLAGFSQGGAIALHAGLRHATPLAGVVALSTYLPLPDLLADEISDAGRAVPIFQAHGADDPIVPLAFAESARDRIAALRAAPEWHTYPMPHSVCAPEIADLRAWLIETAGVA